jgi:tellurite resistance protein
MMTQGYLSTLTVEQRVMLHLYDHPLSESAWEGDPRLTQAGISETVGIARKHLPRTLRRLLDRDIVTQDTRHVPGVKQRCRVYNLTRLGKQQARELNATIAEKRIEKDGESVLVRSLLSHEQSMLSVLAHVDESGNWDAELPNRIEAHKEDERKKRATAEGLIDGEHLFSCILRRAWKDGRISEDEAGMLQDVILYLGLEPERVEALEEKVREERDVKKRSGRTDIYESMLEVAWQDGSLSTEEQKMLDALAGSLLLDRDSARILQVSWMANKFEDRIRAYHSTVETSLKDGVLSDDEEAILAGLRSTLNITDAEHEATLAAVRAKLN